MPHSRSRSGAAGATRPPASAQTGGRSRLGRGRWASGLDQRVEGVLLTLLCL